MRLSQFPRIQSARSTKRSKTSHLLRHAITWDHSVVYLGPKFFKQEEKERAITLIHEAAHLGGVNDTDFDPDQDTGSRKITELLKSKCK